MCVLEAIICHQGLGQNDIAEIDLHRLITELESCAVGSVKSQASGKRDEHEEKGEEAHDEWLGTRLLRSWGIEMGVTSEYRREKRRNVQEEFELSIWM